MRLVSLIGTLICGALLWSSSALAQPQTVDDAASDESGDDVEQPSDWVFEWGGYIRAGYENVQDDPNFSFIGVNDGFVLRNARLTFDGSHRSWGTSFRISLDGATDIRESTNTPQGQLDVRLRDVFLRHDFINPGIGLQVGQFKVPFSAEELRSTSELLFVSRAVGLEGVPVGRGFEEEGIVAERELGAMLSSAEPIYFGGFGVDYALSISNGNGANELLNDNDHLMFVGRLALHWDDMIRLGGSILMNERTIGELPNQFEESQFGVSADLLVEVAGLEVSGQFTQLTTEFPTLGTPSREQLSTHGQIAYRIELPDIEIAPAYRFAYYHPRAQEATSTGAADLDSFQLTYHTAGLNFYVPVEIPIALLINYTFTFEEAPNELENNRLEVLFQASF